MMINIFMKHFILYQRKTNSLFIKVLLFFLILIISSGISMNAFAITIDGSFEDWDNIAPVGTDKIGDISDTDIVDWKSLWITHDDTYLYISYKTCGDIDFTSHAWRYDIFIDADKDPLTGYAVNGIGADYLFQGATLFKYPDAGGGSYWPLWINLGLKGYNVQKNRAEFSIRRDEIWDPSAFDIVLFGDNPETKDFFPDNIGCPSYFSYYLNPRGRLEGFNSSMNYLFYHGEWPDNIIIEVRERFDLVIIHPSYLGVNNKITPEKVENLKKGADGILKTEDDVIVLGYINVGKDLRTYNEAERDPNIARKDPVIGDGSGPKVGPWPGNPSPSGTSYASYYLDDMDTDGIPDRSGGICAINAGDPEWQSFIKTAILNNDGISGTDELINYYGCDGLFLDDVSIPAPWDNWKWTARGMERMLRFLSDTYPDKIISINKGEIFLSPFYREDEICAYDLFSIRPYINMMVFESFYCAPNCLGNRWGWAPKLNAEAQRPDGLTICALDWSVILINQDFSDWYTDYYNQDTTMHEWVRQLDTIGLEEDCNDTPCPDSDWYHIWAAHDQNKLYIRFKCKGKTRYWAGSGYYYDIFIDIDKDTNTGYRGNDCDWGIGADYLIDDGLLYEYCASGCGWCWSALNPGLVTAPYLDPNNYPNEIEFAVERSALEKGGFSEYRFKFRAWAGSCMSEGKYHYDFAPDAPEDYYVFVPDTFKYIERTKVDQGWLSYCTRGGDVIDYYVSDNPPPPDIDAPVWDCTATSFIWGATKMPEPRAGIQEVEFCDGDVTVRWDVARDQTSPVRYNIYYSKTQPMDFDNAEMIANVTPSAGRDYKLVTDKGKKVYPFEYTITGLDNPKDYCFAVRAEDATLGVQNPASGKIGPGGGIEEMNTVVKSAYKITIDGSFDDWKGINPLGIDKEDNMPIRDKGLTHLWVFNEVGKLFISYQCDREFSDGHLSGGNYQVYIDADNNASTGYVGDDGSWKTGAEYKITKDLYQYTGTGTDPNWGSPILLSYAFSGNRIEIALSESDLGLSGDYKIQIFLKELLPDHLKNDYMRNDKSGYTYPPEDKILIDGNFNDWAGLDPIGCDKAGDVSPGDEVDWIYLWALLENGKLFISYQTTSDILICNFKYALYIDIDNNISTGFRGSDDSFNMGADYLIECNNLYEYSGSGTDWGWRWLATVSNAYSSNRMEMVISGGQFGYDIHPPIKLMLIGNNTTTPDFLPDDRSGFIYPKAYPPFDIYIDGNFDDWQGIHPIGIDKTDDFSGDGVSDWEGVWAHRDRGFLFINLEISVNSAPLSHKSNYIYIDTDRNINTGFRGTEGSFNMGADYRIQLNLYPNKPYLYKYNGTGMDDEDWENIDSTIHWMSTDYRVELAVAGTDLGLTGDYCIGIMCAGDPNNLSGDSIIDYAPDDKSGYIFPEGLRMDGLLEDWTGIEPIGFDPIDMPDNASGDLKEVFAADNDNYLYLRLDTYGDINTASHSYIIYLDTDKDRCTGFTFNWWTTGADYRIYIDGCYAGLQKFMGKDQGRDVWGWNGVTNGYKEIYMAYDSNSMECAIPRICIGETGENESFNLLYRIVPGDDCYFYYNAAPLTYIFSEYNPISMPHPIPDIHNYVCYYGSDKIEKLSEFDLVILESRNYSASDISQIKVKGAKVIGYISLGEDIGIPDPNNQYQKIPRPGDDSGPCYSSKCNGEVICENNGYASYYFDQMDLDRNDQTDSNVLGDGKPDQNETWGGYYVNTCDEAWFTEVIAPFIQEIIIEKGCDGLFFDTIGIVESPLFNWTAGCMVDLIAKIRDVYPDIYLVGNGAFSIFEESEPLLNAAMFESFTHTYNFNTNTYGKWPERDLSYHFHIANNINIIRDYPKNPTINILSLDYCDSSDTNCICESINYAKSFGFIPCVSNIYLDQIYFIDCDGDGYSIESDCDDSDPKINPNAIEVCNRIDDNCNGIIDEGIKITYYPDNDRDGFGDPNNQKEDCLIPIGYVENNEDCNDSDPNTYPGAPEICDRIDNNCDGIVPDYEADKDKDGFLACNDCDDSDPNTYPGAPEICDRIDNDCDGGIDEDLICCDTNITYHFIAGWNLITLARIPEIPYTALSLAESINNQGGAVLKVQSWDGSGWKTYSVGAEFGDFEIKISRGYFILTNVPSDWTINGDSPFCVNYTFFSGWNLFGFPIGSPYTAKSLSTLINNSGCSITKVQRWDGSGWQTYPVGAPFGDFDIDIREGIFLLANNSCTFDICNFKITNLRDNQFTVSWTSSIPEYGSVNYGETISLGETAIDDRGDTSSMTHHMTITRLLPTTTYYFEVVSGCAIFNNDGNYFNITTGPSLIPSGSVLPAGQVFESDGITPAEGAIVYVDIKDKDGLGSSGNSALESVLVDENGYWYVELVNIRTPDYISLFNFTQDIDHIIININGGQGKEAQLETEATDYNNGLSPRPDIILP